ncbi:hypothetical protein SUGI_1114830 [Cryptomeria japonica]|nr:hypothetical protein SUGI_1114830 [Cryptomeria japonica]
MKPPLAVNYLSPNSNKPNMEDAKATKANNIFTEATIYKKLPVYIVSQIAGATAAAALLHEIITNTSINVTVTVPVGHPFVSLVVEFIITFIRALVISGTATDPKALSQKIYHNSPIPLTFRT